MIGRSRGEAHDTGNGSGTAAAVLPAPAGTVHAHKRLLITLGIAYGMIILDRTVVNVGLSTMQKDLGAGVTELQWIVDGYVLILASLLLSGGAVGDRLGIARTFRIAVILFTVASALCAMAPDAGFLIAMRMAQGIGAALLMPACWALIAQAYPEPASRHRAMAVWGAMSGSPQALGPSIGGLLVTIAGWRAIFFINVPLGLLVIMLARRYLPASADEPLPARQRGLDVPGQLATVVMLGGLTFALIDGSASGWAQPWSLAAMGTAAIGLVALIVRERRAADPVLPPALFRARGLSAFVTVGTLLFFAYYGFVFALSIYLGAVTHDTALQIGLTLLPAAVPILAVPPLSTRLVSRIGPARSVAVGSAIAAMGFLAVMVIDVQDTALLAFVLLVIGVGSGLAFLPQAGLVMSAAPRDRSGMVSGLMNASRQSGSMVGVAVLGALAVGGSALHGGAGLRVAAFATAVVTLLSGAIALRAQSRIRN